MATSQGEYQKHSEEIQGTSFAASFLEFIFDDVVQECNWKMMLSQQLVPLLFWKEEHLENKDEVSNFFSFLSCRCC
jgi:hypothetical protein